MSFFVFENQVNYEIINYYPLLYKVVIEYKLQKNTMRQQVMFSSPVLRGSYRILKTWLKNNNIYFEFSSPVLRGRDSSLKPITSIVQRQNLLSKIATNHLYYKCRMSHFLTTKFQLYSSYIILYFPMPKLVFIPDPENSPNFNKK